MSCSVGSGEGVKRGGSGKHNSYNLCMSRCRWGRWGFLPVLQRVGLVTAGGCVVGWKISSYWLDKMGCVVRVGWLY